MRILATAGDIDSLIAEIRLRRPLEALAHERGWALQWRSFHDCRPAELAAADVLIVQRGLSRRVLRLQQRALCAGAAVVYEIDDLLTEIAPHISQHDVVRAGLPWLKRCLASADLATFSTARLQHELAPLARASAVVPNHAFFDEDLPLAPQRPGEPVHLLVAASEHMLVDTLAAALGPLLGPRVRLVVVGPPADALAARGLPLERHAPMPRSAFVALARRLPNAVALIALESSRFASCKSAIKWFDYAEIGIPTLASAVPPYLDVIAHGRTGWLVEGGPAQWLEAVRRAIEDAEGRRRVAEAARAEVRARHGFAQTVAAWHAALLQARRLRAARSVPVQRGLAAWGQRAGDAAADWGVALRRWNRARLARRRRA